jgi:hypothetical protein
VPVVAFAAAVLAGSTSGNDVAKVTFLDDLLPVLRQRCGSCHNADQRTAGLDVTTYSGIMAGGGSGDSIAAGNAAGSLLYRVVAHEAEPTMPPDGPPIPEHERRLLAAWIDGGVLENSGSRPVMPATVDVAVAVSADRPEVVPLPPRLPLDPVLRPDGLDACGSLATSPWAPLVAVPGQKQVFLHRSDSLELVGVLPFPEGRPHVVRFSRGGGLLLAGGGVGAISGRVVVWDVTTGRRVRSVGDERDVVLAADVSADQRLVALGGPWRVARMFSLETGEKLQDLSKHTDWVQAVGFSPDGVLLATADRAGGVFLWEAHGGRAYLTIAAHPAGVTSLAWRGDSNVLATGCDDGQIRLFEPEDGRQLRAWAAHAGGVTAVDFTRDGRLASVGRDGVAKLWKGDGTLERHFPAADDLPLAVAVCDETGRLVVGDWTGAAVIWAMDDGSRVGSLDTDPPSLAERMAAAQRRLADAMTQLAELTTVDLVNLEPTPDSVALWQEVARAAADQARWLDEAAFQAGHRLLTTALAEREQRLAAAEAELRAAEEELATAHVTVEQLAAELELVRQRVTATTEAVAGRREAVAAGQAAVAAAEAELDALQDAVPP